MENIGTLLMIGVGLVVGFYIMRFFVKLVAFFLVIAIFLGTLTYDYYFNYRESKNGDESFLIKYVDEYLPMDTIEETILNLEENSHTTFENLKDKPAELIYQNYTDTDNSNDN